MEFSHKLMENMGNISLDQIRNYFDDAESVIKIASALIEEEDEASAENKKLQNYMLATLGEHKHIDAIMVGTIKGNFFSISRSIPGSGYKLIASKELPKGTLYEMREILQTKEGPQESWKYVNEQGHVLDEEKLSGNQVTFDPRKRPWFLKALKNRDLSWTDVYVSGINNVSVITSAIPIFIKDQPVAIFAANVALGSISDILKNSTIEQNVAMLVDSQGQIIAHETLKDLTKIVHGEPQLINLKDINDKVSYNAFHKFIINQKNIFLTKENNEEYIADIRKFHSKHFENWYYLSITPLNYFIGAVKRTQRITLIMAAFILLLSIIIIVWLSKRIAAPIKELSTQANRIKNFDLGEVKLISVGVSEIQGLQDAITAMRRSLHSFAKFVPKSLVKKLIEKGIDVKVGGKSKRLTIFFADIENFTAKSEGYPADKLMEHLSNYFDALSKIVISCNGTVDKYIGDAIMAFWGAPGADRFHARDACHAALLCQKKLLDLNREWAYEKKPTMETRIGIHTDDTIVGNLGSEERLNYTIIGDGVNIASRLEGANKVYKTKIIISESTLHDVVDHAITRPLDIIRVKGKTKPVKIYELMAMVNTDPLLVPTAAQIKLSKLFSHAFLMYLEAEFDKALDEFEQIKHEFGEDYACELFIERCKHLKKYPPEGMWDGITTLTSK